MPSRTANGYRIHDLVSDARSMRTLGQGTSLEVCGVNCAAGSSIAMVFLDAVARRPASNIISSPVTATHSVKAVARQNFSNPSFKKEKQMSPSRIYDCKNISLQPVRTRVHQHLKSITAGWFDEAGSSALAQERSDMLNPM